MARGEPVQLLPAGVTDVQVGGQVLVEDLPGAGHRLVGGGAYRRDDRGGQLPGVGAAVDPGVDLQLDELAARPDHGPDVAVRGPRGAGDPQHPALALLEGTGDAAQVGDLARQCRPLWTVLHAVQARKALDARQLPASPDSTASRSVPVRVSASAEPGSTASRAEGPGHPATRSASPTVTVATPGSIASASRSGEVNTATVSGGQPGGGVRGSSSGTRTSAA